ncbi:hypothetical protein [Nonomuraea sediminis]|uniref:hypothetical protein n=1 Tax=Nonomuraea sediminis TaxID=2835864 RepID=UPI001BDBE2B5|nr:hypothetical protein [Nonomuraea sediminis]
MADLRFLGWRRSGVYARVAGDTLTGGRLTGSAELTIRNTEQAGDQVTETVRFDIMGPGDVPEVRNGFAWHEAPAPGAADAETTKCVQVELAADDLPWRYTPQRAVGEVLRPWLALVVGTAGEVAIQPGGQVTLSGVVLTSHPLGPSARWAHVQEDADGHPPVARLLSARPLEALTSYTAVVVPAFTPDGQPSWGPTTASVTLPVHHAWTFHTGDGGDFPSLARKLHPVAPPDLGRAPLTYQPLPGAQPMAVRGALAPVGSADAAVPQPIADDVALLTTAPVDPRRPVISVPAYGSAWVTTPSTWAGQFHTDPRHRGVAGLGLRMGIEEQDKLADAAATQAGALRAAAQRIRDLTAGLEAARSLWNRRLPQDPIRRLAIFGPALRGMMTATGSVRDRVTAPGRPLPPAIFATATRRALRGHDPAKYLAKANTCPPPPPLNPHGLPYIKLRPADVSADRFKDLFRQFDRRPYNQDLVTRFDRQVSAAIERLGRDGAPALVLVEILDPVSGRRHSAEELRSLLDRLDSAGDSRELADLGKAVGGTRPPERPCAPVDLQGLATAVGAAIDPTGRPFVVDRVLGTIDGLDDQPLTPPELCPDLDIPAWKMLRDHAPDWLLPGAGTLDEHAVTGMATNPAFVAAFLLGLNTQTLGELRFRNIPVMSGCTPLRQFWSRADPAADSYVDDIQGIANWPANGPLDDPLLQPVKARGTDLVVVFRTPLFRRYPATIVYLAPAAMSGGQPDWEAEPDFANRLWPIFQGAVTPEIVFFGFALDPAAGKRHWVVLEEPPPGFRFFNVVQPEWDAARRSSFTGATDGGGFAAAAFADPFRVMIRGSSLIPGGAP